MLFQEEYGGSVTIKCEKCGTGHKVNRSYYTRYGDEYHFNPPVTCCGQTDRIVYKAKPLGDPDPEPVKCPSCGSTQIAAGRKKYGLLASLLIGSQVVAICLNCGFHSGKRGKSILE